MMKTATGAAFQPLDDRYRIGFITIDPGSPISSSKFLPVKAFDNTQKQAFFNILYAQDVGSATPLREALARVGRYFANKRNGINQGINDDPMEYSCQQNFVLLTTDGYWNTGDPVDLNGSNMANTDVDNVNSGAGTRRPTIPRGRTASTTATSAPRERSPTPRSTTTRPICATPPSATAPAGRPAPTSARTTSRHPRATRTRTSTCRSSRLAWSTAC